MDNIDYTIISYLSDGNNHSGQKLADHLQTSRASICKRIAKINDFLSTETDQYFTIETVTGKGYKLNHSYDAIDLNIIYNNLRQNQNDQFAIELKPIIDSTSDYVINKHIEDDKFHVCIAEKQLKGRGRNTSSCKKQWISPFGNNIYCSIAWNYYGNQNSLLGLSLVIGYSIAELLANLGYKNIGLKWPNDILLDNQKVAGILTEIQGDPNGCCKLAIGIGINVNNNYSENSLIKINKAISQPWTSLNHNNIKSVTRNQLISELLANLVKNYNSFIKTGLRDFLLKWEKYDILSQKQIELDIAGNKINGIACGINEQGALVVDIAGQMQFFHSGEVSIKAV